MSSFPQSSSSVSPASTAVMRRVRPHASLTDPKALTYFSTLCNIHGGQGITWQPKNITVTQRAPRKSILPRLPCSSAQS